MTTIRVPKETRDEVKALAEREGLTMASAIKRALQAAESERFWADMASAAASAPRRLSADSEDWSATLLDGQADEDWSDLE